MIKKINDFKIAVNFYFNKTLSLIKIRNSEASIYDFLSILIRQIQKDDIDGLAKSVAFSFILAVFPAIIFIFTIIPYIPIDELNSNIMIYLGKIMPTDMFEMTQSTILDIISRQRSGLMSFGALLAFYSATNGTLSMMLAFNQLHKTKETRGFLRTRLTAIVLTVVLAVMLFLSVFVLLVGNLILDYLKDVNIIKSVVYLLIKWLNYIIVISTFYVSISFVYFYGPSFVRKWRFWSLGSAIATLLFIFATLGFGWYLQHFSTYNTVYGSIGSIIVFMLWMYIIAFVILIGLEINSALQTTKQMAERKNIIIKEKSDN